VRTTANAAGLWRWVSQGEGNLVITDVILPDENASISCRASSG
jgi:two-component system nitrogen regulation response regulator GlnG